MISRVVFQCIVSLASLLFLAGPTAAFFDNDDDAVDLLQQRARYEQALAAVKSGDWVGFERHRSTLGDYPLSAYLDYNKLARRHAFTSGAQARVFVASESKTPLGLRYLDSYLQATGKSRRWDDYLAAAATPPRSERLRCYYARAQRSRGHPAVAWEMAEDLWLSGGSIDDACDPLFQLWREAGGLTDVLVWERAKLAFAARKSSLMRYVSSLGSAAVQPQLEVLRRVYRQPQRSVSLVTTLSGAKRAEVLTLGLQRYSRYNPADALRQWQSVEPTSLDSGDRDSIEGAIAYRTLLEKDEQARDWVDQGLARWGRDDLTELRLRWAIADSDWDAIQRLFPVLSDTGQGEAAWRYWKARALEEGGQGAAAQGIYTAVAQERGFYGFLSADRASLPYSFVDESASLVMPSSEVLLSELDATTQLALWRVHELFAIDEARQAHSEWTYALRRLSPAQQVQLAAFAEQQNWFRLGIDAANVAKRNNLLNFRFPLAYVDVFEKRAATQALPVSELLAIARRESAFFVQARSSAGARGLMQLMPSTGIAVARSAGMQIKVSDLYNVEHNLDLGSAYYRQLLDRFDGNRAVALAAYNAGPNRVQNWVGKGLPMDAWIETIPFRETRAYVKAVLSYSVVFDYRLGQQANLTSAAERSALY